MRQYDSDPWGLISSRISAAVVMEISVEMGEGTAPEYPHAARQTTVLSPSDRLTSCLQVNPMLIDAHVHVWKPHLDFGLPGGTILSPHSAAPVELLDQYLDEHGLSGAVLVQPVYPGTDNSLVADCAAARPNRFAAVCVVDPRAPDAPERLAYWAQKRGCRGLRLRPRIPAEAAVFGSPDGNPLWEACARLNVVVSVLANFEHLATVHALARRFPTVPIVVDHLAHPHATALEGSAEAEALFALSGCDNVLLKVSGYYYYSRQAFPYADCHGLLKAVFDRFDPRRLLWGSDFPHVLLKTDYGRALRVPEMAWPNLSAVDRSLIFGGNARRLYWEDATLE
jgi:L-fuconolactonase